MQADRSTVYRKPTDQYLNINSNLVNEEEDKDEELLLVLGEFRDNRYNEWMMRIQT